MQSALLPDDETQRLASLYGYNVLDSPREDVFDEITELAASICDAPIALISLVDESRQWFKSKIGLDAAQTARDIAFCAHAILHPTVFVVPDTLNDARFADNPLVTGDPHIRFYAGAPLFTAEGHGLGTLCVIDRQPRELTQQQLKTLGVLRTHVLKLLELRRLTRELDAAYQQLETFSNTISNELRAPLRAINGFSQALLEDHLQSMNSEARDLVQRIHNSGVRMDNLAMALVYLAHLTRQPLYFRNVDLSKIAQQVSQELAKQYPGREVEIEIQPGLTALGDLNLLQIAMTHLLDNAWKFTSKCAKPRIEFGAKQLDGSPEFFIRDNGAGFEMAYADRLFQPFRRLHAEADFPGAGMGLAIVKRIVERHGGNVWAESVIQEGTTMHFTFGKKHRQ